MFLVMLDVVFERLIFCLENIFVMLLFQNPCIDIKLSIFTS